MSPIDRSKTSESASLDHTLGAPDPNYILGQDKVQNRKAISIRSGVSGGAKGAAGFAFALNSVTWGLEQYGIFANNQDMGLVDEHLSLLRNQVAEDINRALEIPGMIPEKYRNIQELGGISNVVLSGVNPTENQEIYDIGIRIVKEISDNYRPPIQTHHYENGPGLTLMDNTSMGSKSFPKPDEE
ncbi:hypothetical protein [Cyclobacterium plantarum]|uniref:Uncharacterized protein n=1 Tax=Cyclobacterium plantarum TaxID=2716263 RepID=A0ABX0H8N3_9BACT|nr:hypothetical protein [Cyclobacterium plantarum]NHE56330.1 hypothetical protein [Cyclobacterium plantarum]